MVSFPATLNLMLQRPERNETSIHVYIDDEQCDDDWTANS